jgi:hypothetical protein
MNDHDRPTIISVTTRDGKRVGDFEIRATDGGFEISRTPFINNWSIKLTGDEAKPLIDAIRRNDWHKVNAFDPEILPWYCPQCRRNYREQIWRRTISMSMDSDGWVDGYYGHCPQGHRRMIAD